MFLETVTHPAEEPVTLTEAKAHCRVVGTDDDTYITSLIVAARQMAEAFLNRAICTQTLKLTLDKFEKEITLPRAPVQSVTTVAYTDEDGNAQTFTDYQTSLGPYHAKIKAEVDFDWPDTESGGYSNVEITYVAGFGVPTDSPDLVPLVIKQAVLLTVAELYENREENIVGASVAGLTNTSRALLAPLRISLT